MLQNVASLFIPCAEDLVLSLTIMETIWTIDFVVIEILFKMLLFKGSVLIYAEHCIKIKY